MKSPQVCSDSHYRLYAVQKGCAENCSAKCRTAEIFVRDLRKYFYILEQQFCQSGCWRDWNTSSTSSLQIRKNNSEHVWKHLQPATDTNWSNSLHEVHNIKSLPKSQREFHNRQNLHFTGTTISNMQDPIIWLSQIFMNMPQNFGNYRKTCYFTYDCRKILINLRLDIFI